MGNEEQQRQCDQFLKEIKTVRERLCVKVTGENKKQEMEEGSSMHKQNALSYHGLEFVERREC